MVLGSIYRWATRENPEKEAGLGRRDAGQRGCPGDSPGSEERFRFHARFLDAVGQCVIATEPIGIVTCRNRVAERVYGLAAGAVLGRHLDEMLIPELLQRWAEGTASRSGEWAY